MIDVTLNGKEHKFHTFTALVEHLRRNHIDRAENNAAIDYAQKLLTHDGFHWEFKNYYHNALEGMRKKP